MRALSSEETDILRYLSARPGEFYAVMEITRRAGGRLMGQEKPNWAKPLLSRLVEDDLLEVNERGQYRVKSETQSALAVEAPKPEQREIKPEPAPEAPKAEERQAKPGIKRWISPEIENILKKAGTGCL